jgi:hypothetical protein
MRMKPVIPLAVLMAFAASSASGEDLPSLSNERWRENWSGSDAPWKDIALAPGLALDIGADVRWKPEAIDNPRYGLTSFEDDSWLQQRLLMHFNLRAGRFARTFVELGAFDVMGRENKGANDDNRLDVQQAFLDLTPRWGDTALRARLGRQEIEFGERFFDLGDSSNIRLHYDAARLTLTHGPWQSEAFVLEQVQNNPGAFDDDWVEGQEAFGAQAQRGFEGGLARVFYYEQSRDAFALAGVTGDDRRGSLGFYAEASGDGFDGAVELVRQFGDHGALDIDAWGAYAEIGRSFADAPLAPRIGARLTYGSGDGDAADGALETYAPPFPRGSWFSEAGLVSHSNIVEAAALASLTLADDIKLDAKLAGLWRASNDDFVYVSSQTALAGTTGGDRFIGVLPRLQLNWRASRHVTVRGELSMVVVSDHIEALGGETAAYANASVAWRY